MSEAGCDPQFKTCSDATKIFELLFQEWIWKILASHTEAFYQFFATISSDIASASFPSHSNHMYVRHFHLSHIICAFSVSLSLFFAPPLIHPGCFPLSCLPVYESPPSSGSNITLKPSIHHVKCQAGWITSWNQDSQEKYQLPQICRWYHTNAESEEKLKSLLMRVKEESEKAGLKHSIQKKKKLSSWHLAPSLHSK